MNDTPGWASPGSAPSDGQETGASGPAEPTDRPEPTQPAQQPGADPQDSGSKWSKEQPPPGQWSAPTGSQAPGQTPPPPPPGPGWGTPPAGPGGYVGGHGGYGAPGGYRGGAWGGGWSGPPPAAKPGVIPLRPLGVGEILDGTVSTMRTYWRTVLGVTLTVAVVTNIAVTLIQGLFLNDRISTDALNDPSATLDELARAMRDAMLGSSVVFLIDMIGTVIATALLTTVISRAVLGRSVTIGEAWRDARPQAVKLFGLIFLLMLIAIGIGAAGFLPGFLLAVAGSVEAGAPLAFLGLLGAFVVVLWLMIRFSLASPALMLEKQGIVASMRRSTRLVRRSWWRTFGIQLLAGLIVLIIAGVISVPFAFLATAFVDDGFQGIITSGGSDVGWTFLIINGVGSVIASMITFPIQAGVTVLLYIDQRIRREALDLELGRAAGVQGYGTDTSGG
jgi:hypothetical protein